LTVKYIADTHTAQATFSTRGI